MKHIVAVQTLCVLLLILMNGCIRSGDPVGQHGGDDFPNMVAVAGKAISENLDQQWMNPAEASSVDLSLIDNASLALESMGSALGKRARRDNLKACDSLWISVDFLEGKIAIFKRECTDSTLKNDTLIIIVDGEDTMFVSFSESVEKTVEPYDINYYRCIDLDGDSVVFKTGATDQKAMVTFTHITSNGKAEIIDLGIGAGADGDFVTDNDNIILYASATVIDAGDTVSSMRVDDADGDGYIAVGDEENDSSIIDLFIQAGKSSSNPLQLSAITTARMVVFPDDSTKNYPIRYSVSNQFLTRTVNWIILKSNGDSTFFAGDSIKVLRISKFDNEDSLIADTLKFEAILGDNPCDSLDDKITGISLHTTFARGNEREIIFKFTADTPISSGEEPIDGTVDFRQEAGDGSWIEVVDGTIDEGEISATVTTSGGDTYDVVWDREGKVLSFEKK